MRCAGACCASTGSRRGRRGGRLHLDRLPDPDLHRPQRARAARAVQRAAGARLLRRRRRRWSACYLPAHPVAARCEWIAEGRTPIEREHRRTLGARRAHVKVAAAALGRRRARLRPAQRLRPVVGVRRRRGRDRLARRRDDLRAALPRLRADPAPGHRARARRAAAEPAVVPGVRRRLAVRAGCSEPACRCSACSSSAVVGLTKSDVDTEYVAAAVLFLGVVATVVGLLATLFAARAIADPVISVRGGLERIERRRARRQRRGRRRQRGRPAAGRLQPDGRRACASASASATCSGGRSARTWRRRRCARGPPASAARSGRSAPCSSTSSARPRWRWRCRRPRSCDCSTASSASSSRSWRPRAAWSTSSRATPRCACSARRSRATIPAGEALRAARSLAARLSARGARDRLRHRRLGRRGGGRQRRRRAPLRVHGRSATRSTRPRGCRSWRSSDPSACSPPTPALGHGRRRRGRALERHGVGACCAGGARRRGSPTPARRAATKLSLEDPWRPPRPTTAPVRSARRRAGSRSRPAGATVVGRPRRRRRTSSAAASSARRRPALKRAARGPRPAAHAAGPARRRQLEEVTWDEAFAEIDRRLSPILAEHGRDAVAVYIGNPNAHNLAAMVYGPRAAAARSARKNVFSASTVDQMPKQVSAGLMFGTIADDPGARRRPHRLPADPRREPARVERQPDDGARHARPAARASASAAARSWSSTRAARGPPRRPTSTTSSAPAPTPPAARRSSTRSFAEGLADPGAARASTPTASTRSKAIARRVRARGGGRGVRDRRRRDPPAWRASSPPRRQRRGLRPHRHAHAGVRHARRAGSSTCSTSSPATSTARAARCSRSPPPAQTNAPGAGGRGKGVRFGRWQSRVRGLPEVFGELPVACLAEEIETAGRGPGPRADHGRRQPAALDAQRRAARARRRVARLHGLVDIYLNETTRHADVILPAPEPLEQSHYDLALLPAGGAQRRELLPAGLRERRRRPPSGRRCCGSPAIVSGPGPGRRHRAFDDLVVRTLVGREVGTPGSPIAGRDADEILAALDARAAARARARPHAAHRALRRRLRRRPRRPHARRARARTRTASTSGALEPRLPEVLRTPSGKIELAPEPIVADVDAAARRSLGRANGARWCWSAAASCARTTRGCTTSSRSCKGKDRCTLHVHPDDAGAPRPRRRRRRAARVARRRDRGSRSRSPTRSCRAWSSIPHGWGHDAVGHADGRGLRPRGRELERPRRRGADRPARGNAVLNGIPVEVSSA